MAIGQADNAISSERSVVCGLVSVCFGVSLNSHFSKTYWTFQFLWVLRRTQYPALFVHKNKDVTTLFRCPHQALLNFTAIIWFMWKKLDIQEEKEDIIIIIIFYSVNGLIDKSGCCLPKSRTKGNLLKQCLKSYFKCNKHQKIVHIHADNWLLARCTSRKSQLCHPVIS